MMMRDLQPEEQEAVGKIRLWWRALGPEAIRDPWKPPQFFAAVIAAVIAFSGLSYYIIPTVTIRNIEEQTKIAERGRNDAVAQTTILLKDLISLQADKLATQQERAGIAAANSALTQERERLTADISKISDERDSLSLQSAKLTADIDRNKVAAASLVQQRESLQRRVDQLNQQVQERAIRSFGIARRELIQEVLNTSFRLAATSRLSEFKVGGTETDKGSGGSTQEGSNDYVRIVERSTEVLRIYLHMPEFKPGQHGQSPGDNHVNGQQVIGFQLAQILARFLYASDRSKFEKLVAQALSDSPDKEALTLNLDYQIPIVPDNEVGDDGKLRSGADMRVAVFHWEEVGRHIDAHTRFVEAVRALDRRLTELIK